MGLPIITERLVCAARDERGDDGESLDLTRLAYALAATPLRCATSATMSRMICVRSKSFGV